MCIDYHSQRIWSHLVCEFLWHRCVIFFAYYIQFEGRRKSEKAKKRNKMKWSKQTSQRISNTCCRCCSSGTKIVKSIVTMGKWAYGWGRWAYCMCHEQHICTELLNAFYSCVSFCHFYPNQMHKYKFKQTKSIDQCMVIDIKWIFNSFQWKFIYSSSNCCF